MVDLVDPTGMINRLEVLIALRLQVRRHWRIRIHHSGHGEETLGAWCTQNEEKIKLSDLLALVDWNTIISITCDNCYASNFVTQAAEMHAKKQLHLYDLTIICFSDSDSPTKWGASQELYNRATKRARFGNCSEQFKEAFEKHVSKHGFGYYHWNKNG